MQVKKRNSFMIPVVILCAVLLIAGFVLLRKPSGIPEEDLQAPTRSWNSPKKVEDYFVSNLHMTPEDLKQQEGRTKVSFYITKDNTLEAITSNLTYYGLVRNEKALRHALEQTKDNNGGKKGAIKAGNNGFIDINAFYTISEDMTAWELADTLLNKPNFYGSHGDYGYMFMP